MMTFKELALELMNQGWRCYHIDDLNTRGVSLHSLCIRNLIEVQVYEGKSLVFVKDAKPITDDNK